MEDYVGSLRRLLKKIAMIGQAEKVVFLLWNEGNIGALEFDRQLALGIGSDQGASVPISGAAKLAIESHDNDDGVILNKPRSAFERAHSDGRDFVCCQLFVRPDAESSRPLGRLVGVLYVFAKRYQQSFNDDDLRLLKMLADQGAAVIDSMMTVNDKDKVIAAQQKRIDEMQKMLREYEALGERLRPLLEPEQ